MLRRTKNLGSAPDEGNFNNFEQYDDEELEVGFDNNQTIFSASITFTTEDGVSFSSLVDVNSFFNFDFLSNDIVNEENVRVTIIDSNTRNITNQFDRLANIRNLDLRVKTNNQLGVIQELKKLLKSQTRLVNLYVGIEIEANRNYHSYIRDDLTLSMFTGLFLKYSSLEYVSICSSTLTDEDFKKIKEGITKNKKIRELADKISKEIISLRSKNLSEEDKLICLAKHYGEFWYLRRNNFIDIDQFCELLENVSKEEKELFKKSEDFHLFSVLNTNPNNINSNKFNFSFIKKNILPHYDEIERNAVYYRGLTGRRIIDNIDNIKILTELFNNFGFDPLTVDPSLPPQHYAISALQQCPLINTLFSYQAHWNFDSLIKIYSYRTIILDALAYLIVLKEIVEFSKLFDTYYKIIDCNQPIQAGIYAGFTLIQIMCLHWNELDTEWFDKITLHRNDCPDIKGTFFTYLDSCSTRNRKSILNFKFPEQDERNNPLTVMQYLIYRHNSDLLFRICPTGLILTNDSGYMLTVEANENSKWADLSLLTLFLIGLIDHQTKTTNSNSDLVLGRLSVLFDWIMKEEHKVFWNNKYELTHAIIPFYENGNKVKLPIFHYLMRYAHSEFIDKFIAEKLFADFFSIDKRVEAYDQYQNLTSLHILILYGDDNLLVETYRRIEMFLNRNQKNKQLFYQLLDMPIDGEGEHAHHTLFQVAVLRNFVQFIKLCGKHFNLQQIANKPFPEQSALYKGWIPIQVAIHLFKRRSVNENLVLNLINCQANLSACYPPNFYMNGLNIFQAIVLDCTEDPFIENKGDPLGTPLPGYSSNTGFNFSEETIRFLLESLDANQINAICQDKRSKYYSMTALHITIQQRNYTYTELLLRSPKVNYTLKDSENRRAFDLAHRVNDLYLISLVKSAEKNFPQHITDYQKGLKFDSEVCPSFQVTCDEWVVSIVRERNSEHVFLIIEGLEVVKESNCMRVVVRLAHLTAPTWNGKGKIKLAIEAEVLQYGQEKNNSLLSRLANKTPAVSLKPGMQFFPESDNVTSSKCIAIWNEIEAEKIEDNIYYFPWGNRGLFGVSSSSSRVSCIDWARSKYNSLVKPSSQLPETWDMYFITLARGFLNHRFHYVKNSQTNALEDQVFRIATLSGGTFDRQNALIRDINRLYSIVFFFLVYTAIRESKIECGFINNLALSLIVAIPVGILTYKQRETFFSSKETPLDNGKVPTSNFSPS